MTFFEFDVGQHHFRATKLDVFSQGYVLKRIMPLLGPLVPLVSAAEKSVADKQGPLAVIADLIGPFAESLSNLKDQDLRWLMETCLATVQYEQDGNWVPFWNKAARQSQFSNMDDLSIWLPITVRVIQENLTPFFLELLTGRQGSTTAPAMG